MARLLTIGFELNSTTTNMESDVFNLSSISSSIKRSGDYSLRINASANTPYWRQQLRSADSSTALFYARFYLYIASLPSADAQIMRILNASNVQQGLLRLTTGGNLQLMNGSVVQVGSNSPALSTGTWENKVEIYYNPATGATEAWLNDVSFASGTGTTGSWSRILLGIATGSLTCDLYFDDVAVNDNSGSDQTGRCGSGKVIVLRPNASGDANAFTTQTGGTAGASNNYTRVNEVTPNDATSFNGSSTLNHEDMFNVTDSGIGGSDTVNLVQIGMRFRNSTADTACAVKAQVKKTTGGTISQGSAIVPNSTTWRTNATATPWLPTLTLYKDPDNNAWTKSTLDSMQIGYKITTGPAVAGRRIDVSNVYATVEYIPSVRRVFNVS